MDVLFGLHPVEEALRAGLRRIDHISVARERGSARGSGGGGGADPRLEAVLDLARRRGVRIVTEPREQLTRQARSEQHQGVLAVLEERRLLTLEDLLAAPPVRPPHRFLLALDGVEDPHNFGALLRSADGAGIDGVVVPERRAAPLSGVAAKSSAGASERMRIAQVVNTTRALQAMKQAGVWIVGLDERGDRPYFAFNFAADVCLVLGNEGAGLHDLVRRTCDHLLSIPMAGAVSSLNVSVAGAVVMYEAVRQRTGVPAASAQTLARQTPAGHAPAGHAPVAKPRKGLGS